MYIRQITTNTQMKKFLLTIFILSLSYTAKSQDMLIYKDKTIDEVTIIEVTPDFIKYREYGSPVNSVAFTVEKDYLKKIVLESGRVMDFSQQMINDSRVYAGQRNRAIKIDVAGVSGNYTFLSYEQSVTPSTSWEAGVIFVGAGFESAIWGDENAMGAGVNIGYKFKRSPTFYSQRMRFGHIMRGSYFKPNMFVSTFNYDKIDYDHPPDPVTFMYPTTRQTAVAGSVQMDFGNQLVLADQFLIDYAFGVGYGFTTKNTWNLTNYGFYGGAGSDIDAPYTYSFTLKVGYLLNSK